jgi:hypothetical protein
MCRALSEADWRKDRRRSLRRYLSPSIDYCSRDARQGTILVGEGCNFCPRCGKASVARLLQEYGPMPVPELLRLLSADWPRCLAARVVEPCGVNLPQLADVFAKRR